MKFTCKASDLVTALQTATNAAEPYKSVTRDGVKYTQPVKMLHCVKCTASASAITLTGTDLEIGLRITVTGVDVDRTGSAVFMPKLLKILREVAGDVTITHDVHDRKLIVRTDAGKYDLQWFDPDEYPDLEQPETPTCTLPGAEAKRLIRQTRNFTTPKSTAGHRLDLTSVLIDVRPKAIAFVSQRHPAGAASEAPTRGKAAKAFVPLESLRLLNDAIDEENPDPVDVYVTDKAVCFVTGNVFISTRLIEGRKWSYEEFFPKNHSFSSEIPAEEFLSAVRQARIFCEAESSRIDCEFGPSSLTLKAKSKAGESEVVLPITGTGEPVSISLDANCLANAAIAAGERFTIELNSGKVPALVRSESFRCAIVSMAS